MGSANGHKSERIHPSLRKPPKPWQRPSDQQQKVPVRFIGLLDKTVTQREKLERMAARALKRDAR